MSTGLTWAALDWQSVATAFTGVLAVGAAMFVGLRQNRLMSQSLALSDLTLRKDLFDRRFASYQAARSFLAHIMAHAEYPDREKEIAFLEAKAVSSWVFGPDVDSLLDEIWRDAVSFDALTKEMSRIYRASGHYGEGNPDREHALFSRLADTHYKAIADCMGAYMKLSAPITATKSPLPVKLRRMFSRQRV